LLAAQEPSRISGTIHADRPLDVDQFDGYASTARLVKMRLYLLECGQGWLERHA
jgi:hypothetical protein